MIKWFPYFFILLSTLCLFAFFREQKKFNNWIKIYWGKQSTLLRKIQMTSYIVGMLFLLGALADWRGEEVFSEGKKVNEKTVILLDNSLSMLAEDVRPNRYEKAILMARHFLKASPGHEIAVMLYSDVTKKFVPFTTDIDLLDARLSGLKDLYRNVAGTSNTKQAIREALDYIDPNPLARKGNIIVFTDADAMDQDFPLDVKGGVSVALIAIGTASGAPIPMRGSDGVLRGYKNFQGQQVTSKLNQSFLDSLKNQIQNYKYWVVTSFSLPTTEILDFLRQKNLSSDGESQRMRSREVLYEWWVLPGVIFLLLSLILRRFKAWKTIVSIVLLVVLLNYPTKTMAQENKVKDIIPLLDALKKNQLDDKGKLSAAEKILKSGDAKKSTQIYKETLENNPINEDNKQDWINYSQSLSANKQSDQALKKMSQLQEYIDKNGSSPEFKKNFSQNLLNLMTAQEQQQKKEQQEKQKQEQEEKQKKEDGNNNQQNSPQDKNEPPKDEKGDQSGPKDNKDQQNDKKNEPKESDNKQNEQKSRAERQKELSPLLKQLLNEDRNLQQKLMDTSTKGNKNQNPQNSGTKDW